MRTSPPSVKDLEIRELDKRRERKLKMRRMVYACAQVVSLLIATVGMVASAVAWREPGIWNGHKMAWSGLVMAAAVTIVTGAALYSFIWVSRTRYRWMYDVARYESFDLFWVCVKEQGSPFLKLGSSMVGAMAEPVGRLMLDACEGSGKEKLRKKFDEVRGQWHNGSLSWKHYRAAIDRLFEAATKRST